MKPCETHGKLILLIARSCLLRNSPKYFCPVGRESLVFFLRHHETNCFSCLRSVRVESGETTLIGRHTTKLDEIGTKGTKTMMHPKQLDILIYSSGVFRLGWLHLCYQPKQCTIIYDPILKANI